MPSYNTQMQETIKEEDVLNLINRLVLPRKSFDFKANGAVSTEGKSPIIVHEGLDEIIDALLNGRVHKNNPDWIEALDRYWAREHAAAMFAIGLLNGRYEDYLPGRYLMYKRLVDSGIKRIIEDTTDKKIIELGSGSGISLTMLAREGADVYGLDISETALGFFELLARHYGIGDKIHTVRENFYQTNFPDSHFDLAYNVGVFEHLSANDREKLLVEMKRITKPQGYTLISVPNTNSPHYREMRKREEMLFRKSKQFKFPMRDFHDLDPSTLLQEAGFQIVRSGYVLLAPSVPIGRKIINPSDYEFFTTLPDINGGQIETKEKIKIWELLEKSATPEQKLRYGWFVYAIGKKL